MQLILQPVVPLSATLQTKDFDLIQAVVGSKTARHWPASRKERSKLSGTSYLIEQLN